jgi:two-component system, OmpR family, sensor histidine kinase MprB
MVLLAAGAVAAAVMVASVVVYVATRDELRGQLDASLRQKLTPGQPQAVQVRTQRITPAALRNEQARLARALSGLGRNRSYSWVAGSGHTRGHLTTRGGRPLTSAEVAAVAKRALEGQTPPLVGPLGAAARKAGATVTQEGFTTGPVGGLGSARAGPNLPVLGGNAEISSSPKQGAGGQVSVVTVALPAQNLGGATGYAQLVQPGGQVLRSDAAGPGLPVSAATRAVAAGKHKAFFNDATVAGTRVRMLTERAPVGTGVWEVALPLGDVESTLSRLEIVLGLVCLGGIALAAALGLLVSRAALVPVRRLTRAAESVAQTQDLRHRIQPGEADELGRLADSFNTMLGALERSRLAQRQLVSDASHELRTPLTSIRANLDALATGTSLPVHERGRVIAAARAQLHELTVLVGDLVDLSQTGLGEIELEDVRLDLAAGGALERARLHAPRCRFVLDAEPCLVRAAPSRLDRAIANLLDNASKWNPPSPPGAPVEVRVADGCVRVRDHGPGIAMTDLPHVFDRFYRAPAARGMPGSGLGLAIVRQVADTHGGSVYAANDPHGGARLTLELPVLAMTEAESAESSFAIARNRAVHRVPPVL